MRSEVQFSSSSKALCISSQNPGRRISSGHLLGCFRSVLAPKSKCSCAHVSRRQVCQSGRHKACTSRFSGAYPRVSETVFHLRLEQAFSIQSSSILGPCLAPASLWIRTGLISNGCLVLEGLVEKRTALQSSMEALSLARQPSMHGLKPRRAYVVKEPQHRRVWYRVIHDFHKAMSSKAVEQLGREFPSLVIASLGKLRQTEPG